MPNEHPQRCFLDYNILHGVKLGENLSLLHSGPFTKKISKHIILSCVLSPSMLHPARS